MRCAIWYYLYNLKNVKTTMEGCYGLACNFTTLLKVTLLHGCFSRFSNWTVGTKSRKTSLLIIKKEKFHLQKDWKKSHCCPWMTFPSNFSKLWFSPVWFPHYLLNILSTPSGHHPIYKKCKNLSPPASKNEIFKANSMKIGIIP